MRMTRKEFLVGSAGCALTGMGAPVKSLLGTRSIESEGVVFENPYVTDGLIAMWDGEWNVGWRKHDENSSVWVDLIGKTISVPNYANNYYAWGDKCLKLSAESRNCFITSVGEGMRMGTFELYARQTEGLTNTYNGMFGSYHPETLGGISISGGFRDARRTTWYVAQPWAHRTYYQKPIGGFAIVWAGSEFGASLYHNGTCVDTVSSTTLVENTKTFSIGSGYGGRSPESYLGEGNTGEYYCCRIYDRVLSPEEIMHNNSIDVERFEI